MKGRQHVTVEGFRCSRTVEVPGGSRGDRNLNAQTGNACAFSRTLWYHHRTKLPIGHSRKKNMLIRLYNTESVWVRRRKALAKLTDTHSTNVHSAAT